MLQHKLAIVFPTEGNLSDDALRQMLWGKAAELVKPLLGKTCVRFEPAFDAWAQKIDRPYGVILGRSDPALFLYFYATAKKKQEAAVHFHMNAFLGGMEPIEKHEDNDRIIYSVQLTGAGEEFSAHMMWHVAMMSGELVNDCGIYYAVPRQAVASNALEKEILKHSDRYALCMVTLVTEETE